MKSKQAEKHKYIYNKIKMNVCAYNKTAFLSQVIASCLSSNLACDGKTVNCILQQNGLVSF